MKQRKVWTPQQDSVLKLLIQQRGMSKWAQISDVMEKQFSIHGRNGKQCRQRYHNHLDRNISNQQWTSQEQAQLFDLQDEYGNKWALIASKLPGRSDNCVKNHFYSKLRKGLRKLNKKIHKYLKRDYKDIKTSTLYKIIQTMQTRNKNSFIDDQTIDRCRRIKNKLRQYDDITIEFQDHHQEINYIRPIIEDMAVFDKQIKKSAKKGSIKMSSTLSEDVSSVKGRSNKISTKSMYDQQESSYSNSAYSNSDIFSSSSFDHKSLRSMRSNRSSQLLKPQQLLHRSQSIQSQSQNESSEDSRVLYKSANASSFAQLNKPKNNRQKKQPTPLISHSLKLPTPAFGTGLKKQRQRQVQKPQMKSQQSKSVSNASRKSNNSMDNQNKMIFTYMMGEQQPFEMKIITPKELTHEQKVQMHSDNDDLFYGQKMDVQMDMEMQMFIDSDVLARGFSNLDLNDTPPKLGRSHDI